MTLSLILRAHAKVNLTLDVFSRRVDGYHNVATVMQTIALADTLTVTRTETPGVAFACVSDSEDVPADGTNLAARAAAAAISAAAERGRPVAGGVSLRLEKSVPSQAGLGGGSSDAAAALRGVNAALDLRLPDEALREAAAALGSDVPFFLIGGTVSARGRGELLTPLPDAPPLWLVVVKPEESVSTGWAYGQLDTAADRASHRATGRMEEAIRDCDAGRVVQFQCNDFELPVFREFPKLAWLHDELLMAGAMTAHLCGSGSALYGVAQDRASAERIGGLLRVRYPNTFVTRTVTREECVLQ